MSGNNFSVAGVLGWLVFLSKHFYSHISDRKIYKRSSETGIGLPILSDFVARRYFETYKGYDHIKKIRPMSQKFTEILRRRDFVVKGEQNKKASQSFSRITQSNFTQVFKTWTFLKSTSSWLLKNVQDH